MAIWQFTLDPIPASCAQVSGFDAVWLSREQLDAIELQLGAEDRETLFEMFAGLLPEKRSWSQALRIWGDEKSDDIHVWFDQERLEAIRIRIDVATLSMALVGGLCSLAREFGWVFATRDGRIVQPTVEAVAKAIGQSDSSRYVRDPKAFLEAAIEADKEVLRPL
jgi:hypothetical protein